jgi:hypothetical protein
LCTRRGRTLGWWIEFAFRQWSTSSTLICVPPKDVGGTLQGVSCGRPGLGNPSQISQVRISYDVNLHSAALPLKLEKA